MEVVGALLLGWGEGDEARLVMILGETHAHLENAFNRRRGETLSLCRRSSRLERYVADA